MAKTPYISGEFQDQAARKYGLEALPWLRNLPDIIADVLVQYELRLVNHFDSYEAIVFEASSPSLGQIVAKFGFPTQIAPSISASRAFSNHGGVPVLAADEAIGYLLMRKIEPGQTLFDHFRRGRDDEATELAAVSMHRLRNVPVPSAGTFRSISEHSNTFTRWRQNGGYSNKTLPHSLVERAESMLADLLADKTANVLLHGDLHHDNFVVDGAGKVFSIDPKGRLGDPAYEVGAWMRNPMEIYDVEDCSRLLSRRLDIFCAVLGDDRERLQAWSFVQMCLAAMWLFEDELKFRPKVAEFAELLLYA